MKAADPARSEMFPRVLRGDTARGARTRSALCRRRALERKGSEEKMRPGCGATSQHRQPLRSPSAIAIVFRIIRVELWASRCQRLKRLNFELYNFTRKRP